MFRQLRFMYHAVIIIYIALTAIISIIYSRNIPNWNVGKETASVLNSVLIMVAIATIPLGYYLYSQKTRNPAGYPSFNDKLKIYRRYTLIRFGLFDTAGFCSLVTYFLTGSQQPMYLLLIIIILFLINKPTVEKFTEDFKLSEEEADMLKSEM